MKFNAVSASPLLLASATAARVAVAINPSPTPHPEPLTYISQDGPLHRPHKDYCCFTLGSFDPSTGRYPLSPFDGSVGESLVDGSRLGQGPFCFNHTTGIVQDTNGAHCIFDEASHKFHCCDNCTGKTNFRLNIHHQQGSASATIVARNDVDAQCSMEPHSCPPPWHRALKWCQQHPNSDRCPWLPWTLSSHNIKSDNGDALRFGIGFILDQLCGWLPGTCPVTSNIKDVVPRLELRRTIQGFQDILDLACEVADPLCPFIPLVMDAVLSILEALSDISRLGQAARAYVDTNNSIDMRALSRSLRTAHTEIGSAGQSNMENASEMTPEEAIEWLRGRLNAICEKNFPVLCQYVPNVLGFIRKILESTDEDCEALSHAAQAMLSGLR
ncbi:hypothetical protein CDEST_13341 [Colletotrichum destructivum]|uniref:Uncharacterized protein n=1 Tax=Colletotrichum destructivum TaxID=34406 RepID=A0AAX4IYK2_9PEZI|nr:hypothetical protein CDEST_13341 [Colletotrichum destructivum]